MRFKRQSYLGYTDLLFEIGERTLGLSFGPHHVLFYPLQARTNHVKYVGWLNGKLVAKASM